MAFKRLMVAGALLALIGSPVLAAELKIGVVNVPRLVKEAPQSVAAGKRMEKEFAERQRAVMEMQRNAQEMEDKLARDGAILTAQERQSKEKELVAMKRELKNRQEEYRDDFEQRNREENERIQRTIIQAIDEMVKSDSYDLILGDGVIHSSKSLDVTDKLMERLKKMQDAPGKK